MLLNENILLIASIGAKCSRYWTLLIYNFFIFGELIKNDITPASRIVKERIRYEVNASDTVTY